MLTIIVNIIVIFIIIFVISMLSLLILLVYKTSSSGRKSFSKSSGYYHWVLIISIYSFVYLFIFSVNEFILTNVNKNFL